MTMDDMMRLAAAQQRVFRSIEEALREDGHHKSYEGAMEVSMALPNFFERQEHPKWTVELHCYVLLDGRHQVWSGRTLSEAIASMENDLDKICMPYEMNRFGREMGIDDDEPGEADGSVTIYGPQRGDEIIP